MSRAGTLRIVGVGPGDPELLTVKAARLIAAAPVVAFFAKRGRPGNARGSAAPYIAATATERRLEYPFTTERDAADPAYARDMGAFYAACAATLAEDLAAGRDVALLCEGDPFLYGSAMYLFDRLDGAYAVEVVPGVSAMSGCWASARLPITHGDDVLTVLPGTLDEASLVDHLTRADAAVVMKLGRNMRKVVAALDRTGRLARAVYVERGTMAGQRVLPAAAMADQAAPYFALVLVPGRQRPR